MISPSFESFYLLSLAVLTYFLNPFLKNIITKPFYKLTGQESLPIFGIGIRPAGARSCHNVLDGDIASTFGMPSGHSQIIWTIGTYFLLLIISRLFNKIRHKNAMTVNNEDILEYTWIIISSIIIVTAMVYVSYSRVYIEGCHTIEQVIVGGIVGSILGCLAFYLEDTIRNWLVLKN
jgi:membrane-associated phospholipid phosphatase